MATDTVEGMSPHIRGLTVTTLTAVAGLSAGVVSNEVTGGTAGSELAVAVLVAAIVVQFPILHAVGIEYDGLSTKDKLYVAFMTFAMWFISWGILLTSTQL